MKRIPCFIIFFVIFDLFYVNGVFGLEVILDANSEVPPKVQKTEDSAPLFSIKLYQDYISSVDGDRCPMQPPCSQYCIEAFKKHGALLGWIMCSDRLMRCGRDEKKLSDPIRIDGQKRSYDPVSNNDFWWQ